MSDEEEIIMIDDDDDVVQTQDTPSSLSDDADHNQNHTEQQLQQDHYNESIEQQSSTGDYSLEADDCTSPVNELEQQEAPEIYSDNTPPPDVVASSSTNNEIQVTGVEEEEKKKESFLSTNLSMLKNSTKAAVRDVMTTYNASERRFSNWTNDELKELLVQYDVQIRGSLNATHESLISICEQVFPQDFILERTHSSSPSSSDDDIDEVTEKEVFDQKNNAALLIQKAYIRAKAANYFMQFVPSQQQNESYPYHDPEMNYNNNTLLENHYIDGNSSNVDDVSDNDDNERPQLLNYNSVLEKINDDALADEEIEVDWIKPSWRTAKFYQANMRPHKLGEAMEKYHWKKTTLGRHCTFSGCGEQLDLWDEGKTSEFAQFGSGITNYFKFLKWCCWIMLILSVVHLPIAIINTYGSSVQYDSITVALTTFGNLGNADQVLEIQIPGCDENEFQQVECSIRKDRLGLFYSVIDVVGTLIVIIGLKWLGVFERSEARHLNVSTVTASDYTMCVKNLPPDTKETELAAHFAKVSGEAVASVYLAYANAKEIKAYFKRGELIRKRFDIVQRIRYEKTKLKKAMNVSNKMPRRLKSLLKQRTKLTRKIRQADAEREDTMEPVPKVIKAFVTFEQEQGFINAASAYQLSWIRSVGLFFPKRLKFRGAKLNVTQAPEPSTIIWENLETSIRTQSIRKTLTNTVALLAVLLSVVFTFLARDFQNRSLENLSQSCPKAFDELPFDKQYEIIQYDSGLSHCYCSTLSVIGQSQEDLCRDYLEGKVKANLMSSGAGFIVVFMNSFFTFLMDKAGTFEKHHSLDEMEASVMVRVFILKFLNTGCLVLLYNQRWLQTIVNVRFDNEPEFGVKWYETGGVSLIIVMCMNVISPHLSPLLTYFRHKKHLDNIEQTLLDNRETNDKVKIWYSQDDLNKEYLGPEFRLTYRYTQILVNFYVCWMYSTSMPLMPIIGAVSFYTCYWVDKFLFCNFYRTPPKYSDKMGRTSTKLVGIGVILHLVMSLWMLGNKKIFRSEAAITKAPNNNSASIETVNRSTILTFLNQTHLFPIEILLVLFIAYNVFRKVWHIWGHQLNRILTCITCRSGVVAKKRLLSQMNTVQVDYSSAKQRGIIKGLASYNMLQNPKYQEAFAISAEFANAHSHLNSIRGLNTKESAAGGGGPVGFGSNDDSDMEYGYNSSRSSRSGFSSSTQSSRMNN